MERAQRRYLGVLDQTNPEGFRELTDAIRSHDPALFSPESSSVYPFVQAVYPGSERNLNYRSTIDLCSGDFVATLLQYVFSSLSLMSCQQNEFVRLYPSNTNRAVRVGYI